MKKILLILLVIIATSTKAQTGVPDTLAYLQYIVANKSKFIGKPFSVLQDSLKIKIKFFSPRANIPHKRNWETSTSFSFYFTYSIEDHYLSYPRLRVYWQPHLNMTESNSLFNTLNGAWGPSIIALYAPATVADIDILNL
jgi:hypothetical protein